MPLRNHASLNRQKLLMVELLDSRLLFTQFVAIVDNPYFPLISGTRMIYQGTDGDGGSLRIEATVPEKKQVIEGVRCTVNHVREFVNGELSEETYDWYAQDVSGKVWYLGEESSELEDGEIVSRAGSWQAGVDGARAGIIMQAQPRAGDAYAQEHVPGVAEDRSQVISRRESLRTQAGRFDNLLLIADSSPLEPDVLEYKYYARNVGLVHSIGVAGELEDVVISSIERPMQSVRAQTALPVGVADAPLTPAGSSFGRKEILGALESDRSSRDLLAQHDQPGLADKNTQPFTTV